MRFIYVQRASALLLFSTFMASLASGASLLPSQTLLAPGELGPTGGVIQAGTGIPVPFVAATFSGTLTSTVIAGDPSNPYGGLTFTYLLTNDNSSPNYLSRITVDGYAGFLTDASYQITSPGIAPTLVDRSSGIGNVIGYSFINPLPVGLGLGVINPGEFSTLLVVHTNASAFTTGTASVIDGSVVSTTTFRPVPEPGTIGLLCAGLVMVTSAYVAKRRRARILTN